MSDSKPTNPKDMAAVTRLPLGLVPDTASIMLAQAFAEGAFKYGQYNWRIAGVRMSVYVAAIGRHLMKFWNGQWSDPKTKVPHLSSIMAGCVIIEDARLCGKLTDDRPPALDLDAAIGEAEAVIQHLAELFKDRDPVQWTQAIVDKGDAPWNIDKGQEWQAHDCAQDPPPVEGDVRVDFRVREGVEQINWRADHCNWSAIPSFPEAEIVAWRRHY